MNRKDENQRDSLPQPSRRDFCAELMLISAGVILAPPGLARDKTAQDSTVAYPPRRIEGSETLLPGGCLYFTYPTRTDPAVLLRLTDGEYRAYSRRCSHSGCSVEFDPPSKCLKCPCHRGTFDAEVGAVLFGPPRRPLDAIILQVRAGGQLWATGKRFGREGEVITARRV